MCTVCCLSVLLAACCVLLSVCPACLLSAAYCHWCGVLLAACWVLLSCLLPVVCCCHACCLLCAAVMLAACCPPSYRVASVRSLPQVPAGSMDYTTFSWSPLTARLKGMAASGEGTGAVYVTCGCVGAGVRHSQSYVVLMPQTTAMNSSCVRSCLHCSTPSRGRASHH
jgi:hypothetical protein